MESKGNMIDLPTSIAPLVAFNENAMHLYVSDKVISDPVFLTWRERNKRAGYDFTVTQMGLDEISDLRSGGMRKEENVEIGLDVKNEAIRILDTASQYGASDVHFMLRGSHAEIQIVVDGKLMTLRHETHSDAGALVLAIFQGIATTKDASFNPLDFQNAQISGDNLPTSMNVSSIRIVRGPCYPQGASFLTLRMQYTKNHTPASNMPKLSHPKIPDGVLRLSTMGYSPSQVQKIKLLMNAPNGLVVFTGPTGSGKTTAMFEALQEMARIKPYRRLVTAEDPVEYPMPWGVQLPITNAKNASETAAAFSAITRTMLRMAPNVIQLGELRDADVALTAMEMSVTGHQVWTTLHVDDPYLLVDRLELMDAVKLNRKIFCDHKIVRGIVAQRLLPKLCPHCSVSLSEKNASNQIEDRIYRALSTWGDTSRVRVTSESGCVVCSGRGTMGRFAVAEVVITNAKLMDNFVKHGSEMARKEHRKGADADVSMMESAILKCLEGTVDPVSIEDKIDLIESRDSE